jgi:sortase (surface protein transpeptidase)
VSTRPRRSAGLRILPFAAVAGVVLALLVGVLVFRSPALDSVQWKAGTPTGSSTPTGPAPTRVRIPTIAVDSALVDLRLDAAGALESPKDYAVAGWYADGTRPGDAGPAIIAGHVDTKQGPAVFFRLHELRAGQTIEVMRGERWVSFKVLAVRKYPKSTFPTDEVYAPTPNAQLRLITCGGTFDSARRSYVDNVVVYAVAV